MPAILLASHNMSEVERLCDQVLMMRRGQIVDRGTPAELLSRFGRETLEEVFLDIARDRRPAGAAQGHPPGHSAPTPTPRRHWNERDRALLRRIGAMLLRHVFVLRGSWPRPPGAGLLADDADDHLGLRDQFLATNSSWVAHAVGVLLAAVLLWDALFRGQIGFALSFLEEMWSRNLGNLFVSPLRPVEHLVSMMLMSMIRTLIGVLPAALLAIPFYHYSVFSLGLPLIAFSST